MRNDANRVICMLLAIALCFALAACGESERKDADNATQQSTVDSTGPADTAGTTAPSTAPETVPVETTEATQATEPRQTSEPTVATKPAPDPSDYPASVGATTLSAEEKAFFEKAAFIGDSVTLKLRNYNAKNAALGNTTFLCQGSYSVAHAVNNTMYLSYQGQDITPQDALAACGAERVFILLGMNDIALWGIDKTMENWATLVGNIRSKCPDIEIYIQSGTPIYTEGEIGSLNNNNMNKYNARLQEFAQTNGCYYVDVNTPFKNASGGLASAYCSDAYVHFTDAACELWVKILSELV